uniref:Uncharacterized protein n=1 Tax=Odontella aurita TaxID=265563 RepID=A0A7S4MTR9_9STRA|mmetsp:Transcript_31950/g.95669  ORF Transcript_31950/g.95669 Transcript_31950/m.95669 type:complete len:465 (+) Transcript_31950:173-1567(+)
MAKTKKARPRGDTAEAGAGREYLSRRMDVKRATLERKQRKAAGPDEAVGVAERANRDAERTIRLSHDTDEKKDRSKIRLHITKTRREIDVLRARLKAWDGVEEKKKEMEEAERKRKAEEEAADEAAGKKKKKRGRLGPETWKLRGAARPAWEVYDFDTRYVCPHMKAHEDAREKTKRVQNVLSLYRGRFGEERSDEEGPPQPYCRQFLSLLMQLGHLSVEAKKLKSAREAFLECIDLEGTDPNSVVVTMARARLMRMCVEANRPESARRLWERIPHDSTAWVRYSAALIEFVSWSVIEEDGSSRERAEEMLRKAIEANKFCAYYIAFNDTFEKVVEYGDEIEDAEAGTLEEAIEYCHSEQMGFWLGTEGAAEWIREVILRLLHEQNDGNSWVQSTRSYLESWEKDISQIENQLHETKNSDDVNGDENEEPDIVMYAGMFRTAMDMLQDAGEFLKDTASSSEVAG